MERATINIEGMSCEHCVKAVTEAVGALPSVTDVDVEIGAATLSYDPAAVSYETIKEAIEDQGFDVA
jgi:copper chaperone